MTMLCFNNTFKKKWRAGLGLWAIDCNLWAILFWAHFLMQKNKIKGCRMRFPENKIYYSLYSSANFKLLIKLDLKKIIIKLLCLGVLKV